MPGLLNEPVNLFSNIAFILAALLLFRKRARHPNVSPLVALVPWLILTVGVGSTLFHSFAMFWSILADTIPIGVCVLWMFGLLIRKAFQLQLWAILLAYTLLLIATLFFVVTVDGHSVNFSQPYFAAVIAIVVIAILSQIQKIQGRHRLVLAGLAFVLALIARMGDAAICPHLAVGSHFAWHIFSACGFYLIADYLFS
ncbi:MAG: ceramidase domain-containing protein [Deltaproteobacteria bacterium]|nr:ceramidase domain-containing protein [Deltaproteobacteria bacterium]